MAYFNQCSQEGINCYKIRRFSNPDLSYLGDPTGVPADHPSLGVDGPADARRTINDRRQSVASRRSATCTNISVSSGIRTFGPDGGTAFFAVDTSDNCVWQVLSQADFISVKSEAFSAGPGFVEVSVATSDGTERAGSVKVAGQTVTVRQLSTEPGGVCARTPRVADAITRAIGFDDCAAVTESHLTAITGKLDLAHQGIETLRAGDFAGLSSVTDLDLYSNRLSELPTGVFNGLDSLRGLSLYYNQLSELPAEVFDGLSSLTWLSLSSNQLSELPDDVFDGLPLLTVLYLDSNQLRELPAGVFDGLSSLNWLWLDGNPGAPIPLILEPEQSGPSAFVVNVAQGAPFAMTATVAVTGGTAAGSVTVPTGAMTSDEISVKVAGDGPVTVTLGATPAVPADYTGIRPAVGKALTLDRAAPALASAAVAGDRLVLVYDKALDKNSTPSPEDFSAAVAGSPRAVTDVSVAGMAVTLTLASKVTTGQTVTLSYTAPDTGAIRDWVGNAAAGFADEIVTDDVSVPALTGAAVSGIRLVLTYDEALDENSTPLPGDFSVAVAGSPQGVSGVSVAGTTVTLTLGSAVLAGQTVTLSYTIPDTGAIRDLVGNAAVALADVAVANDTDPTGVCDRSAPVQAVILSRIPDVDDCAAVTESNLTAITGELDLAGQGIEALRAGDFDGLSSLTYLNLRVSALGDDLSEPQETLTATLAGVSWEDGSETPLTGPGVELRIAASDPLTAALMGPETAREGEGATYRGALSGGTPTAAVTAAVEFDAAASSADRADFTGLPEEVMIAAGRTEASFTVQFVEEPDGAGGDGRVAESAVGVGERWRRGHGGGRGGRGCVHAHRGAQPWLAGAGVGAVADGVRPDAGAGRFGRGAGAWSGAAAGFGLSGDAGRRGMGAGGPRGERLAVA